MAVCCQNLTLGAVSSRSVLSLFVGVLFKKFLLFLNTPRIHGYEVLGNSCYRMKRNRKNKKDFEILCVQEMS